MNWSKVVSDNNYKGNNVEWPDINTTKKLKSIKTNPTEVDVISRPLAGLQLSESTDSNYIGTRTREEVLVNRKLRKEKIKEVKIQEQYEKNLKEIRAPKSEKIKVIDGKFLKAYQDRNVVSNSLKSNIFIQESNNSNNAKPLAGHLRIKQILKNKNAIKIDLMDLVVQRKSQRQAKEKKRIQRKITKRKDGQNVVVRHKGKKREFPRAKWKTPLKRCILAIRKQRRAQFLETSETKVQSQIDSSPINVPENINEKSVVTDFVSLLKEVLKYDPSLIEPPIKLEENENKTDDTIVTIQHSRKFRPYCNNTITPELCKYVEQLLADVFRFQSRAFDKNEIKARAQKRFVVGFKETQRQLDIKKLQLLVIAPDLEPNVGPGGLDETVTHIKCIAEEQNLPYVFAVRRHRLGNIFHKKVPVSCIGVIDYSGSEENFKNIIRLLDVERYNYQKAITFIAPVI